MQPQNTTQFEVQAVAAMVLANIPYPPLPVVAGRGECAVESVASSHDILLSAISAQLVNTQLASTTVKLLHDRKCDILHNLHLDLSQAWDKNGSRKALLRCYDIIRASFRSYLALYPGSPDLRLLPADSVVKNDLVHRQGLQHLQNGSIACDHHTAASDPAESYPNLLQAYIFRICGEGEPCILPAICDDTQDSEQ